MEGVEWRGDLNVDQHTSIHDHVVGHPKDLVQYAPELPSVQAGSCFPTDGRLPQKHVKLSNKTLNLCFIDCGHLISSCVSCVTFERHLKTMNRRHRTHNTGKRTCWHNSLA